MFLPTAAPFGPPGGPGPFMLGGGNAGLFPSGTPPLKGCGEADTEVGVLRRGGRGLTPPAGCPGG